MRKLFSGIFVLVFLAVLANFANAQEDAPKPKYMVWEVKVSPAQLDKTLEAIKFQHDFLKSENYPYAGFVQYTNDGLLYYSTPFMQYAEIDEMNATDKTLWEENPEKGKEVREKFEYTFYPEFGPNMSIVYFIDELGDNPADHYKKSDEMWAKFGEEGKQLWEDVKPLIDKMESHIGWADYDMSYFPSN